MDDAATRDRARGRWKILRNALLSKAASQSAAAAANDDADETLHSIHRFAGFQMIPEPCPSIQKSNNDDDDDDDDKLVRLLRQGLTRVFVNTADQIVTSSNDSTEKTLNRLALDLLCSLVAWQALYEQQQQPLTPTGSNTNRKINSVEWTIAAGSGSIPHWTDQSLLLPLSWQATIAETLLERGYHCTFYKETKTTKSTSAAAATILARLWIQPVPKSIPTSPEYTVQRYSIPTRTHATPVTVVTRERSQRPTSTNQRRSLHELTSHVHHDGIDNTGNICVWDCERTLTWAVLLSHGSNYFPGVHTDWTTVIPNDATRRDSLVVLELGSGMAALAALSLAVQWCNLSQNSQGSVDDAPPKMHVYITDGHDDSVFNNQVNVRLMQAAGLLSHHVSIECRKLLWTVKAQANGLPMSAHVTLVSDCTHFVEYHAELYWTAVHHTRVGGRIWMCQPHRGDSWLRFVRLIHHVNDQAASAQPLVSLVEPLDIAQHLQSRHEEFQQESSVYNANVHRPHVFILTKLRDATASDRDCVLHYQHGSHR
jgi:Lysine methyltransferase